MSQVEAWKPAVVGGFDRLAWRRSLRGSAALRGLSGSEWAVLWFAYDHSDGMGQVDLPKRYLAESMGISEASVKRAVRRLSGVVGLLEEIGRRPGSKAKRYRLSEPGCVEVEATSAACEGSRDEAGSWRIDGGESAKPRAAGEGVMGDPPGGARGSWVTRQGGHGCAPKGVMGDPQSRDKSREQSSKPPGSLTGQRDQAGGLFDERGFDRAAAAILISSGLRNPKRAAALVAQHKVTRLEARNIRANLRAARRAKVSVRNAAGWVVSMVQAGEVTLDQRVLDEVEGRRMQRRRRLQAAERAVEARAKRQAAERDDERREAARERLKAMGADERSALVRAITAEMSGGDGQLAFKPSAALLERWLIDELMKRDQNESDSESEASDGE